jgi:hypothetical protein
VAVITSTLPNGMSITAKGPQMAYTLPIDLQVLLQVQFQDAKGNPAQIDGDPEWSSSDPNIAKVVVTPGNPYLANLAGGTATGNAQVIVSADAAIGDEVREIICTMDVTVVGGEAVVGVISPASEPAPPSPGGPG